MPLGGALIEDEARIAWRFLSLWSPTGRERHTEDGTVVGYLQKGGEKRRCICRPHPSTPLTVPASGVLLVGPGGRRIAVPDGPIWTAPLGVERRKIGAYRLDVLFPSVAKDL